MKTDVLLLADLFENLETYVFKRTIKTLYTVIQLQILALIVF